MSEDQPAPATSAVEAARMVDRALESMTSQRDEANSKATRYREEMIEWRTRANDLQDRLHQAEVLRDHYKEYSDRLVIKLGHIGMTINDVMREADEETQRAQRRRQSQNGGMSQEEILRQFEQNFGKTETLAPAAGAVTDRLPPAETLHVQEAPKQAAPDVVATR